ncbi:hypothetical protein ACMD2_21306 [Ananas comosus]|uniref:Uncharacterized protein n=1 Tax=Ananas comosus TaxID=4615 RepID=A0A199UN22_ANACO|nr:hypothetical protein ACMD2_21306 [Ananas comosus]
MSQERGEGRFPTARGTPREPGLGDEAFWRSQVNFGPLNPATDEKDRGSVYVVTLPAFQRCLEDGPDAAERRPGSGFPTSRGQETAISRHITTYRQDRRDPGKATRLGVRGSIVPASSRTSYSSFLKARVRDLFSATEKNQRS